MISDQNLIQKEISGFKGFFHFWFIQGPIWFWERGLVSLENFEGIFAVRLMLKHITEPIFQDYTRAGRFLGFGIRLLRIIVSLLFYLAVILLYLMLAIIWLILPFYAIWQIIS